MKAGGRVLALIGAGLVLALGAPTASALDVLIADDVFNGSLDFLATALADHTVTHLDNYVGGNPLYTEDPSSMAGFDVVIFYGSGGGAGREITADEASALEVYIHGGGSLIVTGYDVLGGPDDPRLADVVRSSTYGDTPFNTSWTAANVDHFILNGPFGDYRGASFTAGIDQDQLTADAARGAVPLATVGATAFDKIIFTDLPAPGGSVGMWNGNRDGLDWSTDADQLAILRNWLAGVADGDGDGVFDADDDCPDTAAGDPVDADGCSTDDDDGDGVLNDADDCPDTPSCAPVHTDGCPIDSDGDGVYDGCDDCADTREGAAVDASGCPTGCCGASGPVAPLGLTVGMLVLARLSGRRRRR